MPQTFDLDGARKAGYSDAEIVSHLAGQRKFDLDGARKSGYSDTEILDHLAAAPKAESAPAPTAVKPKAPSAWDRVVSSFGEFTNPLGDPQPGESFDTRLKKIGEGLAGIPLQSGESLHAFGKALTQGKLTDAAWHLAGVVPILGPAGQQIAKDLDEGNIAEAIGHGAGILASLGMARPDAAANAVKTPIKAVKNVAAATAEAAGDVGAAARSALSGPEAKALARSAAGAVSPRALHIVDGLKAKADTAGKFAEAVKARKIERLRNEAAAKQRAAGRTPLWQNPEVLDKLNPDPPVAGPVPMRRPAAAAPAPADPVSPAPAIEHSAPSTVRPRPATRATADPAAAPAQRRTPMDLSRELAESLGTPEPPTGAAAPPFVNYPAKARSAKARALAKFLDENGFSQVDALLFSADDWKLVAKGAQVNPPSAQSIEQAVAGLTNIRTTRMRQAAQPNGPTKYQRGEAKLAPGSATAASR